MLSDNEKSDPNNTTFTCISAYQVCALSACIREGNNGVSVVGVQELPSLGDGAGSWFDIEVHIPEGEKKTIEPLLRYKLIVLGCIEHMLFDCVGNSAFVLDILKYIEGKNLVEKKKKVANPRKIVEKYIRGGAFSNLVLTNTHEGQELPKLETLVPARKGDAAKPGVQAALLTP